MPDHLDTACKAIEDQLADLRQEVQRLEAAKGALDGGGGARRGRGRPRGSSRTASGRTSTRRRSRSGGPTRADEAHDLVKAHPGITIPELAGKMGDQAELPLPRAPGASKEKKVTKRGKGWHAASSSDLMVRRPRVEWSQVDMISSSRVRTRVRAWHADAAGIHGGSVVG